jgi:hypothetical protein
MQKVYELIIPETVEAVQLSPENSQWVAAWSRGVELNEVDVMNKSLLRVGISVPGLRGMQEARYGDYVIKKRCGDFVVAEAHAFESKYRQVNE